MTIKDINMKRRDLLKLSALPLVGIATPAMAAEPEFKLWEKSSIFLLLDSRVINIAREDYFSEWVGYPGMLSKLENGVIVKGEEEVTICTNSFDNLEKSCLHYGMGIPELVKKLRPICEYVDKDHGPEYWPIKKAIYLVSGIKPGRDSVYYTLKTTSDENLIWEPIP